MNACVYIPVKLLFVKTGDQPTNHSLLAPEDPYFQYLSFRENACHFEI